MLGDWVPARTLAMAGDRAGTCRWRRKLGPEAAGSEPWRGPAAGLQVPGAEGVPLPRLGPGPVHATSIQECSHRGLAAPCPGSIASRRSRPASGLIDQAGGRRRRRRTPADRPQRSGVRQQQIVRSGDALVVLPSIGINAPNGGLALPAKLAILASCYRKGQEPEFYMASPTESLNCH